MSKWDERDREELAVVDAALRAYPLAPVPPTLAPAVLGRIASLAPAPRFRLLWIDYALWLFGAGMVGLMALFWQVLLPNGLVNLVPMAVVSFDVQSMLLWLISLLAGLILLLCCLAVAAVVLEPGRRYRVRFTYGRRGIF